MLLFLEWLSPTFLAPGTDFHERQFLYAPDRGDGLGMIEAHYMYCAVYFCYLLHQFHLRSSGIVSLSLGTPALEHILNDSNLYLLGCLGCSNW